jgi:hypothetical protein
MKTPVAISEASSETKGKKVYRGTLRRRPTLIGQTHMQGTPGGEFVKGSEQINDKQSKEGRMKVNTSV